jgi:hypothetical protein
MPTWAKVLLTVVAIGIALFIAAGFIGYHWFMKNKDHFMTVRKDGVAYGTGKEATQCVDAALTRLSGGLSAQIDAKLYLDGCLTSATPSPTLCADVPPASEIMRSAQWSVDQCRKRGILNQQGCTQLFQSVSQYCQKQH